MRLTLCFCFVALILLITPLLATPCFVACLLTAYSKSFVPSDSEMWCMQPKTFSSSFCRGFATGDNASSAAGAAPKLMKSVRPWNTANNFMIASCVIQDICSVLMNAGHYRSICHMGFGWSWSWSHVLLVCRVQLQHSVIARQPFRYCMVLHLQQHDCCQSQHSAACLAMSCEIHLLTAGLYTQCSAHTTVSTQRCIVPLSTSFYTWQLCMKVMEFDIRPWSDFSHHVRYAESRRLKESQDIHSSAFNCLIRPSATALHTALSEQVNCSSPCAILSRRCTEYLSATEPQQHWMYMLNQPPVPLCTCRHGYPEKRLYSVCRWAANQRAGPSGQSGCRHPAKADPRLQDANRDRHRLHAG